MATGAVLISSVGLAACTVATGQPRPSTSKSSAAPNYGRFLNCGESAQMTKFPDHHYDLDGDGVIDLLMVMRCRNKRGDQLEVFTGKQGLDGPHRLGGDDTPPIVHRDERANLDRGCLVFAGRTVFVAEGPASGDPPSAQVTWIGQWSNTTKRVETVANEAPLTIPCVAEARP